MGLLRNSLKYPLKIPTDTSNIPIHPFNRPSDPINSLIYFSNRHTDPSCNLSIGLLY